MSARVLVAGNAAFDVIVRVDRLPRDHEKLRAERYATGAGGSAVHTAVRLARRGLATELVSAVGDDPLGHACLEALARAGVGTSRVQVVAGAPTGVAMVLSQGHAKRMVTVAGPDRSAAYDAVAQGELAGFRHVHVTGEPTDALGDLMGRAHAAGCSLSAEWNGRDLSHLVPPAQVNFMNSDELAEFARCGTAEAGGAAATLAGRLGAVVAVTLGERGALWADPGGSVTARATTPVEPVDRTGGGDAFDAGVIAAYLEGLGPEECLDAGLACALEAISQIGLGGAKWT